MLTLAVQAGHSQLLTGLRWEQGKVKALPGPYWVSLRPAGNLVRPHLTTERKLEI